MILGKVMMAQSANKRGSVEYLSLIHIFMVMSKKDNNTLHR